ncbi:MAG: trypsin-like peptidase domain-containing protein, partial [Gemmatimonadetes bacterium]|nr:trypsin-like peptidase domain-containing protein [Gemmatimonadota bacterium]
MVGARLTVLTGFIAGTQATLPYGGISLGRNEGVGLRFDPQQDLHVSGRHAAINSDEDGWFIQDLGSLNGTFVNGHRISFPVRLRDQDQIQLGEGGPLLEFRVVADAAEVLPPPEPTQRHAIPQLPETHPGQGATQPPEVHPFPEGPQTGAGSTSGIEHKALPPKVWRPVALLSAVLVIAIATAAYSLWEGRRYRNQVMTMQARIDSILDASAEAAGALQGRIQGLSDALLESRENLEAVHRDLGTAQEAGDSDEIRALRVQLQEAQAALVRHQLAANLDYDAIEAENRQAVAKVFVDFGEEIITATAFSVRSDATLMTNRHVVTGTSGNSRPRRIAVQFADSRQVWPARVLATSNSVDLALLKIDNIVGEVPTVSGFNDLPGSIQSGQGVGVIGFPLGGAEPSGETGGVVALTTLTAGIVRAVTPDVLEVNGYGVEGSSGSPVFDGQGKVVGVLFGGRVE